MAILLVCSVYFILAFQFMKLDHVTIIQSLDEIGEIDVAQIKERNINYSGKSLAQNPSLLRTILLLIQNISTVESLK